MLQDTVLRCITLYRIFWLYLGECAGYSVLYCIWGWRGDGEWGEDTQRVTGLSSEAERFEAKTELLNRYAPGRRHRGSALGSSQQHSGKPAQQHSSCRLQQNCPSFFRSGKVSSSAAAAVSQTPATVVSVE